MGGGLGESGVAVLLLLSSDSADLLMIPLLTDTVLLGIGGPRTSSSSLKVEFLFPFVISTEGI